MKKVLASLALLLFLFSCGSKDSVTNSVAETPTTIATGDRVFVKVNSGTSSNSKSTVLKSTAAPSEWQTQYDSLKSEIIAKTGRTQDVDGYFIFDSKGNIKEMGMSSNQAGMFAVVEKFEVPSSNLPIFLYGCNPNYMYKYTSSIRALDSGTDTYGTFYVRDNYNKTSEGLAEDMEDYSGGYTQKEIFNSPIKNSIGEIRYCYANYSGIDGMEIDLPINTGTTTVYSHNYTNPKYVFNGDKTISMYSEGNLIGQAEATVYAYTYNSTGNVETMTITVGSDDYTWTYDSNGRVISSTGKGYYSSDINGTINHSYTYSYSYDSRGIVTHYKKYDNTLGSVDVDTIVTYSLTSDNFIKAFSVNTTGTYSSNIWMTYTRDTSGNITKVNSKLEFPYFGSFEAEYAPKN